MHIPARARARTHACTHARTHAKSRTHNHARTHARTHTHTQREIDTDRQAETDRRTYRRTERQTDRQTEMILLLLLLLLLLLRFATTLPHNHPTVMTDRPLQITYLSVYICLARVFVTQSLCVRLRSVPRVAVMQSCMTSSRYPLEASIQARGSLRSL